MPYGPAWKAHRRTMHQYFNKNVVHNYNTTQERQIIKFLKVLLAKPDDILELTRLCVLHLPAI